MLHSASLTITGNLAAHPRVSGHPDHPDRVSFRVISNHRRRDAETGEWIQAGQYAVDVVCWRRLARGAAGSLHKGDPVRVTGRIGTREFTGSDGHQHWRDEVTADFIGLDLTQGMSGKFTRFSQMEPIRPAETDGGAGDDTSTPGAPESTDTDAASSDPDPAGAGSDGFSTDAAGVFEAPAPVGA